MALPNFWIFVLIPLTYLHHAKKILAGKPYVIHEQKISYCSQKTGSTEYKFLKKRTETHRVCYNKQPNFCVNLLRKAQKDYCDNLNEKDVIDNMKFWKTRKPILLNKPKSSGIITLVHEDKIITNDDEDANTLNSFNSGIQRY